MTGPDAWQFYESLGDGERSDLTERQLAVAAICDLRQEVNSGGFDSYFRFWGGNTAQTAARALLPVLGHAWADLLDEAMDLLGPEYPNDVGGREARLESIAVDEALNLLDARFYELEASTDADALLSHYLVGDTT